MIVFSNKINLSSLKPNKNVAIEMLLMAPEERSPAGCDLKKTHCKNAICRKLYLKTKNKNWNKLQLKKNNFGKKKHLN